MSGLIGIIIVFLLIGGVFKVAFSAVGIAFKLVFWILGFVFSIIGWVLGGGLLVLLGFAIVGVPIFFLARTR